MGGAKVPRMGSGDDWLEEPKTMWGTLSVAPNPADPGTLVRSEVKTLPGDYRGFYANVRDAINGVGGAGGDGGGWIRVIKLLEMARVSSAEGRTLKVEF